ncbi:MAG: NHL repeat-containing protein [Verrucomicrobiia bacterium]|jgi:sugar lactone lactonase YvrE
MITAEPGSVKGHFMKLGKAFLLAAVIPTLGLNSVFAQIYNFTTIAGTAGTTGSVDGAGTGALFNDPMSVAVDNSGNIYVADYGNSTIREISPIPLLGEWGVATISGTAGTTGSTNGIGTSALFNYPTGIAINNSNGTLYVADYGNSTIREIVPLGSGIWDVSTIAGTAGASGSVDGFGSAALFSNPVCVAVDSTGNVYVADDGNNTIRAIVPSGGNWWVFTIAGKAGTSGSADGTNNTARFESPAGLAVDSAGNVYVADYGNNTIRKIAPSGTNWVVTTIAGKAGTSGSADGNNNTARFYQPSGLAVDASDSLYVADAGNDVIRKITPVGTNWVVTTIAGTAKKSGNANGTGSSARFDRPIGVALDSSGNVYVADTDNDTIRQGLALAATFVPFQGTYNGLAIQTNAPSQASSGSLTLVLAETGSFAANLTMGGGRAAFGGQFDQSGNVTNAVTGSGSSSWQVILHLDLTNGTEEITGTVSNGEFRSELVADLAVFSKANACPQTGVYTFVVTPPADNDPNLPQGWGLGTLTIATTGIGKLSGTLGDGTKLTGTVPISKYGTGPLYVLLYGNKGSCVGWLNITNNAIESTVDWFKPPVPANHFYPAGFTNNVVTLLGSKYVAPAKGSPMLSLTNTTGTVMLTLGGGNLGAVLSNSVMVATDNTVTILPGNVTKLTLKLAPKNGTFSGSFLPPGTRKAVKFQGAALQLQDFGAGFFTGTNETGYVTITPVE